MKSDIVIGAITNYNWDQIKYWVNSLNRSGYDGIKALLCYNIDYDLVQNLNKMGIATFVFGKNVNNKQYFYKDHFSIVVERFHHLWLALKGLENIRYIITTDVKDVIFQKNPIEWIENNIQDKKILVSTESIHYKDEEWGYNNILKSFGPHITQHNQDNLIYNCGVLAGDFQTMIDLFLNIFMLCNGTSHYVEGGGGPDQAALNILLNLKPYKYITKFAYSEEGWAAQLGTTGPQIFPKYSQKLVENVPVLCYDSIQTSTGTEFTIVHQYDRVPNWREIIETKFGE